jgi:hypothetical protein
MLLLALLAAPSWSQEEVPGDTAAAPPATEQSAETADPDAVPAVEEVVDDDDLDLQTYEEDDDDFVPTEEIPADEPIPFPSNI